MGLGSRDNDVRKEFRTSNGLKSDWKAAIKSPDDARALIGKIKDNVSKDINGDLIIATYCQDKINLLQNYITYAERAGAQMTLKDYVKKER